MAMVVKEELGVDEFVAQNYWSEPIYLDQERNFYKYLGYIYVIQGWQRASK
jgi:hypothetical protein